MGETSKCRDRVLKYCKGIGIDIGCGDDKVCPDAIGLDRRDIPGVTCIHQDLYNLPFKDNKFDYVFSSHCLEDLKDKGKALREWIRVLKPGGFLILYLPHKHYYPNVGHPLANKAHYEDIIPSDIISLLNTIGGCDLISNQTYFPPNGIYVYENRGNIEYSFEIVVRKR